MGVNVRELNGNLSDHERAASIAIHQKAVARALRLHGVAPDNWVPERPGTDHDVTVVGGGQSGVAIAFALRRAGIARTTVIDAASEGQEGVWLTTARMNNLRSPKTLPGPELGIPELGFQAWYEARQGEAAYAAMTFIPRLEWAAYLKWYRAATGVSVRYDTRLESIKPAGQGFRLKLSVFGNPIEEVCRKIVLATGFAGSGNANVPAFIRHYLPEQFYAHTEESLDFERLRGRRIAIFGAASAAFDTAAAALENGAATVHMFCRHDDIERYSLMRTLYFPGSVEHYRELSDADRWRIMSILCRRAQGPVPDTVRRVERFESFYLHLGARDPKLRVENGAIHLPLAGRDSGLTFDFVIAGTGYSVDLSTRPELAAIVDRIALWRDRYHPEPGQENADLARYPYLTPGFAFTEKEAGTAPYLRNIHFFSAGAMLSNGRNPGEVSGMRFGIPQLVSAIGRDLFRDDAEAHVARVLTPVAPILTGVEYQGCLWKPEGGEPTKSRKDTTGATGNG